MSRSRRALLFAALLLLLGEGASISLTLRRFDDRQTERIRLSRAQANAILPAVSDWMRQRGPETSTRAAWIEPFDELVVAPDALSLVDAESRRALDSGELSVIPRAADRTTFVLGRVSTSHGVETFRLTLRSTEEDHAGMEALLLIQHGLIFIAILIAGVLAVLARETNDGDPHAFGAYEEAMVRLRQRDHERVAAFEKERAAVTAILRDREAMARAGELTAGIVHEVGNSLGTIAIHARRAEGAQEAEVRAAGTAVAAEVRAIQSVMDRFVAFIRTEKVHYGRFSLDRMVRRVAARESERFPTSIEVTGDEVAVQGDEDLLERAIENVVRNACQAAGPAGHVWIHFRLAADTVIVQVTDDGPGIADPQQAVRLFESNRPGGLGLGLPLVLKILSLHQGRLDIQQRREGTGAVVICEWPQSAAAVTVGSGDPLGKLPAQPSN